MARRKNRRKRKTPSILQIPVQKKKTYNYLSVSNMLNLISHMGFKTIYDNDVRAVMNALPEASKIEIVSRLEKMEEYNLLHPVKENGKCLLLLPAPKTVEK